MKFHSFWLVKLTFFSAKHFSWMFESHAMASLVGFLLNISAAWGTKASQLSATQSFRHFHIFLFTLELFLFSSAILKTSAFRWADNSEGNFCVLFFTCLEFLVSWLSLSARWNREPNQKWWCLEEWRHQKRKAKREKSSKRQIYPFPSDSHWHSTTTVAVAGPEAHDERWEMCTRAAREAAAKKGEGKQKNNINFNLQIH